MFLKSINSIIYISTYSDPVKVFILIGFLVLKVVTNEKSLVVKKLILKMCYFSNVKILFLRTYKGSHLSLKKNSLHFTNEEIKRL